MPISKSRISNQVYKLRLDNYSQILKINLKNCLKNKLSRIRSSKARFITNSNLSCNDIVRNNLS